MRRAIPPLMLVLALMLMPGCGGGDDGTTQTQSVKPPMGGDERVIRGWIGALNEGEYDKAADYFANGAIVEQLHKFRLRNHRAAVDFNRSLPCRAKLTKVAPAGTTSLGFFELSGAPGNCDSTVRVRFLIVDGKIRQWRQLAPRAVPQGRAV